VCFSATASFAAGTVLSAGGVATMATALRRSDLPFAAIPLLFGVQQLVEGGVWLSFGSRAQTANEVLTYVYAVLALVFWPIFIPWAIRSMEPEAQRRRLLLACQVAGLAVGGYLLYAHTPSAVSSRVVDDSIVYANSHFFGYWIVSLYFVATIGSSLLSSSRRVQLFGGLVFLGAALAYGIWAAAFVSVRCFFAARWSAR
jgi:hypothetical protein